MHYLFFLDSISKSIYTVPPRPPNTANNVRRNNVWLAGKDDSLADNLPIFSGNCET